MFLVQKYAKQIEKYVMVNILDPLWITAPGFDIWKTIIILSSLIAKHSRIILWVVLQSNISQALIALSGLTKTKSL